MRSNSFQEKKEILLFIDTHVFFRRRSISNCLLLAVFREKDRCLKKLVKDSAKIKMCSFCHEEVRCLLFSRFSKCWQDIVDEDSHFFLYISMLTSTCSNCKCSKTKLCTSECRQFIYDDTRSWTSSTGRKKPYRMIELSQKGKKKKKKKLTKFSWKRDTNPLQPE